MPEDESEELAGLHHAGQALAYYMGYRYHTRRKRTAYRVICVVGIGFHIWSALKHLRDKK